MTTFNIVTYLSEYRRGFGMDIGFIDHFNTQLVITFNYSTIANFHTLENHTKSFPARSVFTNSCLVTASNMASSVFRTQFSPNGGFLTTARFGTPYLIARDVLYV
jgi:hypothetical protein